MKVIFVTRGWPTEANPMSGNFEAVQARALAKRGHDVTVIYIQKKSIAHFFQSKDVRYKEIDGITVLSSSVTLAEIPKLGITKYNNCDLRIRQRAFARVYEYYRKMKGDADVIHAHYLNQAYDCKAVLEKYHIPFIITEHWSKMNSDTVDSRIVKLAKAYQWADKVICVSSALSDSLKKKFGVESTVLHNMVSDRFFDRFGADNVPKNDKNTRFVSVGSLVEGKGFDVLIRAFQKSAHLSECQLTIIGGGPEENNLNKLIERFGLKGRVVLTGRKPPEEVSEWLSQADCFVLTSRGETFGVVYIEAMAKGRPVIATICGGPEAFVNDKNGILVPVDDVDATARAIDYMVENKARYDSEGIRQYCYEHFSEEHIVKETIAIYKQVIEQHK